MKLKVSILFWLSFVYVIIAIVFWGRSLTNQSREIIQLERENLKLKKNYIKENEYRILAKTLDKKLISKKWQYLGEGGTFLFFILLSGGFVFYFLKKENKLNLLQKNFILSFTHELKTPISGIKLSLQTLQKRKLNEETQNEIIAIGISEANRLNNLCNNLLYMSRIESDELKIVKEEFDINPIIEQIIKDYSKVQDSHKIYYNPKKLFLVGDKSMFQIVLSNLINNAIKYSPNKDKIEIKTFCENKHNILEVIDFGKGIEENKQQHIFEKYNRLNIENENLISGTGLGLYIVKKFCILHKINVDYKYKNNESIFRLSWIDPKKNKKHETNDIDSRR